MAHHPSIHKEVDELLANGATEPSTDGTVFHWNVFVITKCTGGLQPMLNLKESDCYMYIPNFKMLTTRQVWQCIQHGDYVV